MLKQILANLFGWLDFGNFEAYAILPNFFMIQIGEPEFSVNITSNNEWNPASGTAWGGDGGLLACRRLSTSEAFLFLLEEVSGGFRGLQALKIAFLEGLPLA